MSDIDIWNISDDEFVQRIKESATMADFLKTFGLKNAGNNYRQCRKRLQKLGLNTDIFLPIHEASNYNRQMTVDNFKMILASNKKISRVCVKKYIIRFKLIEYICKECGIRALWNKKPISLQLEHINGIPNDNRLENLCFLCPNCHSQTSTFSGKKLKGTRRVIKTTSTMQVCQNGYESPS